MDFRGEKGNVTPRLSIDYTAGEMTVLPQFFYLPPHDPYRTMGVQYVTVILQKLNR